MVDEKRHTTSLYLSINRESTIMNTTTKCAHRGHHALSHALLLCAGIGLNAGLNATLHADTLSVCLDGTCDYADIQTAIDAASNGDVIQISGETYLLEARLDTAGKALTFVGTMDSKGKSPLTTLDGQGVHQILEHRNETESARDLAFTGLRIQNGVNSSTGGFFLRGPGTAMISHCEFLQNAGTLGGALLTGLDLRLVMEDTLLQGNRGDGWGGAIKATEDVHIMRCRFLDNQSSAGVGGAIAMYGAMSGRLEACEFSRNSAQDGGAVHTEFNATLTAIECTFEDNVATKPGFEGSETGGGLAHDSTGRLELTGCSFSNNQAGLGGGVYASGDQVIEDCTFTNNTALTLSGFGGGYHAISDSSDPDRVTFRDCLFTGNESGRYGGALSLINEGSSLSDKVEATLTGCRFESNTSASSSGALLVSDMNASVAACHFEGNVSGGTGGAIAASQSTLAVDDCTITGNFSEPGGGGLGLFGGLTVITGSVISDNEASGQGGGVYISLGFGGKVELGQTLVCGNVPDQISGAPFADDGSNCVLEICTDDCRPDEGCFADIDDDGEVGSKDLSELLARWGCIVDPPGFACAEADLNEDGTVDGADLTLLISSWGQCD